MQKVQTEALGLARPFEGSMDETVKVDRRDSVASILFFGFFLLFCVWILSMPVFPSQDGSMHKYYVHALSQILSGSHNYDSYVIRHPFPPYATHYLVLLGLQKVFSPDLSEKLLVCLILACIAFSFRYCAKALGPSWDIVSLCMLPLLLSWPLFMGFFNYTLGIGLFFLALAGWSRLKEPGWQPRLCFFVAALLLMFTHPVPLLLLIAFLALDLSLQVIAVTRRDGVASLSIKKYGWEIVGIAAACIAFLYPLSIADKSRSVSNLKDFGFHTDVFMANAVLYGISPFYSRSRELWINLYRAGILIFLIGALALASLGILQRVRTMTLRRSDTFLFASIAFAIAIPILPPAMNGAAFFSERLPIFVCFGALAACSGYEDKYGYLRRFGPWVASALILITLFTAHKFITPVAYGLARIEAQPMPHSLEGLGLSTDHLREQEKAEDELGFRPYMWSVALPLIHSNGVLLNSPFLDMTTMPLKAAPHSDQAIANLDPSDVFLLIANANFDTLPPALRTRLLQKSKFIVVVGTESDLNQGLATLIGTDAAAKFHCTRGQLNAICIADEK